MGEYTKGDWRVGKPYMNGYETPIYADTEEERDYEIATVHIYNGEQVANARLISKAPRMYEVIKYLATNGWNAGVSEEARAIFAELEENSQQASAGSKHNRASKSIEL